MTDKINQNNEKNDIEKQTTEKNIDDDNNEPLETVKQKALPGINASLVMLYGIFFSMFAIGWITLNSCPINRLIPIYLIISGFTGAIAKFLSKYDNKYVFNIGVILGMIFFIWQGLGTYYVYREYQPNYDAKLGKYCNRIGYLLAFWILTLQYTTAGFVLLVSGCYMMMKGDFKKK